MAPQPINEVVSEWFTKFRAIPADVHILCPKISDDDVEDYAALSDTDEGEKRQKRVEEGEERIATVYWSSLLLAMPKAKNEQCMEEFGNRLSGALRKCDKCVMNWHMKRKAFLSKFQEYVITLAPLFASSPAYSPFQFLGTTMKRLSVRCSACSAL